MCVCLCVQLCRGEALVLATAEWFWGYYSPETRCPLRSSDPEHSVPEGNPAVHSHYSHMNRLMRIFQIRTIKGEMVIVVIHNTFFKQIRHSVHLFPYVKGTRGLMLYLCFAGSGIETYCDSFLISSPERKTQLDWEVWVLRSSGFMSIYAVSPTGINLAFSLSWIQIVRQYTTV